LFFSSVFYSDNAERDWIRSRTADQVSSPNNIHVSIKIWKAHVKVTGRIQEC